MFTDCYDEEHVILRDSVDQCKHLMHLFVTGVGELIDYIVIGND